VSLRLRSEAFRLQLALRGMSQADLARKAGLSEATVSAAARGVPVAPQTLRRIGRIGKALAAEPLLGVRELVDPGYG
jgi:transcriptional regulator with XRE-family HTH domain